MKVHLLDQSRVFTKKYGENSLTYIGSKLWNELDNVLKLSDFVYIPLNTKYQSMDGTKMSL